MRAIVFFLMFSMSFFMNGQVEKNSDLYKTILKLDQELFEAYNNCSDLENLKKHASFYAEDIEFFHDSGGLETSKTALIESIKNNICGKVKRELVEGSIEVYKIPNYGVVTIGYHKFHNLVEKSISEPSKFIGFWRKDADAWRIAKVVSLH